MAERTVLIPTGLSPPGRRGYLEATGRIAVEIGHTQRNEVTGIFAAAGYRLAGAFRDLGGNDRVLMFRADEALQRVRKNAWQYQGMQLGSGHRMRRSRQCS